MQKTFNTLSIHHIKPQGTLKPSPGGTTHLQKLIRKELGYPKEIPFVTMKNVVVLFNSVASPEQIISSLEVLVASLRLRIVDDLS